MMQAQSPLLYQVPTAARHLQRGQSRHKRSSSSSRRQHTTLTVMDRTEGPCETQPLDTNPRRLRGVSRSQHVRHGMQAPQTIAPTLPAKATTCLASSSAWGAGAASTSPQVPPPCPVGAMLAAWMTGPASQARTISNVRTRRRRLHEVSTGRVHLPLLVATRPVRFGPLGRGHHQYPLTPAPPAWWRLRSRVARRRRWLQAAHPGTRAWACELEKCVDRRRMWLTRRTCTARRRCHQSATWRAFPTSRHVSDTRSTRWRHPMALVVTMVAVVAVAVAVATVGWTISTTAATKIPSHRQL